MREWHYELTKDMTLEERRAFYNEKAMRFLNGESAGEDVGSKTPPAKTARVQSWSGVYPHHL